MSNIFDWNLIETNKSSGTAKAKCPICTPTRKNKSDKSLYINLNSGIARCFNCDALSFRDNIKKQNEVKYKIPEQTWQNYTKLSDSLVKYFEEERKIKQYTLNKFRITEEIYYQPALGKKVRNVVFNYFEGDTVVNKKYRTRDKHFTQSTGGKPIFYNINSVIGKEEAYIVEGEIDVLSFSEVGIDNVISVPNGANDNDAYWVNSEPYIKDIKKFYIAVDDDEKGNVLAEKIVQRLGRYRCERVIFDGKDANEDLQAGVLEKTAKRTKKYPISGTFQVNDMLENMYELYDNGLPPVIYPKHKCFGEFRKAFSTMLGHLVVGTGIPSHGKSNFTEWLVLNLVKDYNLKASFFSPEHMPMWLHQSTFVQKVIGKNYFKDVDGVPRVTKEEIQKYAEWANERIYLTSPENGEFATWNWMFEKFKEQMFQYGINIFVIDAFNKVDLDDKGNELAQIRRILGKLTTFAQTNNVLIILIAHPTKMKKGDNKLYEIPTLYDVNGSADFRNQTHDGFCIYRFFADAHHDEKTLFINLKTKYSFQGEMGMQIEFEYHKPSGRFYAYGTEPPTFSLIDDSEYEVEKKNVFAMPEEAFDINSEELDDIPF